MSRFSKTRKGSADRDSTELAQETRMDSIAGLAKGRYHQDGLKYTVGYLSSQ